LDEIYFNILFGGHKGWLCHKLKKLKIKKKIAIFFEALIARP
jgi:hypothetical protein